MTFKLDRPDLIEGKRCDGGWRPAWGRAQPLPRGRKPAECCASASQAANTTDSWDGRTHADVFMQVAAMGGVFDCITEIAADGSLVGELAESWEASVDLATWTFNLRKGVEFHNGKQSLRCRRCY